MKYLYWSVCASDINKNNRNEFSPRFMNKKEAELWKMKYIIEHPDDYIMFDLMQDDGKLYVNDIGYVISAMWDGRGHKVY